MSIINHIPWVTGDLLGMSLPRTVSWSTFSSLYPEYPFSVVMQCIWSILSWFWWRLIEKVTVEKKFSTQKAKADISPGAWGQPGLQNRGSFRTGKATQRNPGMKNQKVIIITYFKFILSKIWRGRASKQGESDCLSWLCERNDDVKC